MDHQAWASLPSLFFTQAERRGEAPFLWQKRDGAWRPLSWQAVADAVRAAAAGLAGLGIGAGDRVALVAENRPEWLIADLAIMTLGAIAVPTFTTNTVADHRHILSHSGARAAVVGGGAVARRVLEAAAELPELAVAIAMDAVEPVAGAPQRLLRWAELGGAAPALDLAACLARLRREDTSCFIYTSGTGGTPKGVMLTHGSILANCDGAHHLLREFGLGEEVFLSFLPLSHSYEHTAGQFFPILLGAQIYYAESVEKLTDNMLEARPTIMTAVPRLYEVMRQRIERQLAKAPGWRQRLVRLALELGRQRTERPGSLGFGQRLLDGVAERLVREKLRQRFGGRLKCFVSGGAALNYEVGIFFTALGLRILQGYGQTEASPVISCNPPGRVKLRAVGPPLKDVEVRIAEDGEILVRGELVMKGYWRDPAATAQAVREGWLHTGDVGRLDADGYLEITDRKKDLIVLSGGDNVSPARVEGILSLEPEIAQAVVEGDSRPHLVAVLVPSQETLAEVARRRGRPAELAALADDPELAKALGAALERVNRRLSQIERIRRFAVAREPFTIENGLLTGSLKVRRHKVKEQYRAALAALYEKG
ncbi:MAG: long-chain fatty acid--CoA ligase [Dongiaceae bacterium]